MGAYIIREDKMEDLSNSVENNLNLQFNKFCFIIIHTYKDIRNEYKEYTVNIFFRLALPLYRYKWYNYISPRVSFIRNGLLYYTSE